MPDLSAPIVPAIEFDRLVDLRHRAASHLAGDASRKGAIARSADALTVLHGLASSPQTAADALALLHELQVYQVELDLQAQELRESREALEASLRRQVELYDFQPAGLFTLDAQRVVMETNRAGADMLGLGRDDLVGLTLDAFLLPESARRFRSAMVGVDVGMRHVWCPLTLSPRDGVALSFVAAIGQDPAGRGYLVNLTRVDEEHAVSP